MANLSSSAVVSAPLGERPGPEHVQPVANESLDRFATGVVTVVPVLAVGLVVTQVFHWGMNWTDFAIAIPLYILTGLGITVGFHRLLTHRAFKTTPALRAFFSICGSMAIEGPVISWVADHRKHHAFADKPGDPHSPHVDHGHGFRGALRGLAHAHVGWIFLHTDRAMKTRYAPDLIADPIVSFVNRYFLGWVLLGLALPFGLGYLIGGDIGAALTALLWGGAMRILLLHHVTYSINSLCHFFGRRRFDTDDHSRNLWWLAPLSFGEAWHNNHHAFPTSAAHGLRKREFDPSQITINLLEKAGLAWDVVRISPERQATKALQPAG